MTQDESRRLHERIDVLNRDMTTGFRELGEKVATIAAGCPSCREGDRRGRDLNGRVTILEAQRANTLKLLGMLVMAASAGGTIAGVIVAILR